MIFFCITLINFYRHPFSRILFLHIDVSYLLCSQENQKNEISKVEELEERLNRQELRYGTGIVGEAAWKIERGKHPEEFPEPSENVQDENRRRLISERHRIYHTVYNLFFDKEKTFKANFFPLAEGIEMIFNTTEYFLSRNENVIYRIISEESLLYLRNMDLLIDWGCYCVQFYDERSPEDNQHVIEIIYKLYHKKPVVQKYWCASGTPRSQRHNCFTLAEHVRHKSETAVPVEKTTPTFLGTQLWMQCSTDVLHHKCVTRREQCGGVVCASYVPHMCHVTRGT